MNRSKQLRVVVAGGGTGGHITPALAVAESLKKLDCQVTFIGSLAEADSELVKGSGFTYHGIQAGKLRRYFSWQNVPDFFRVGIGFLQARSLLSRLKPDVVFTKGGYVSVPVAYAAAFLEIPVVAHESDVVMGLANRLVSTKAELVCTGFPVSDYLEPLRSKLRFTGNPIRELFSKRPSARSVTLHRLNFTPSLPVVLVMGSSQGALPINELLQGELEKNVAEWQIIHLTGPNHLEAAEAARELLPTHLAKHYRPFDFVGEELLDYLAIADLVVSRSSASSLAECAALGKAMILIPLPSAASDHQRLNAQIYAQHQAALVYEQDRLTPAKLHSVIADLLKSKEKRKELSRSIKQFSSPKAADLIAELVVAVGRGDLRRAEKDRS